MKCYLCNEEIEVTQELWTKYQGLRYDNVYAHQECQDKAEAEARMSQ
jgi:hypothetical protein